MKSLDELINESRDVREVKRALSVKMLKNGASATAISELLNVSVQYVSKWKVIYETQGTDGLSVGYQGSESYLTEQERNALLAPRSTHAAHAGHGDRRVREQTRAPIVVVTASASSSFLEEALSDDVTDVLLQRHKISDAASADFTVTNQNDTLAALNQVTGTFTILLAAIGGISLLVGGIGIMNIMLVSVNERTREIGIRKAVGARRRDILAQFLIEAIGLTGIGGVLGILLGWGITVVVHQIPAAAQIPILITAGTVAIAVGVSVAIGVVFGLYPAMRAARLHPIQALRYE